MAHDDRTGDTVTTFDRAVRAVSAGTDPIEAARSVLAAMTPDERLWCLDGDLPFWAGLGDLGTGGYHKRPFPRRASSASASRDSPSATGPAAWSSGRRRASR